MKTHFYMAASPLDCIKVMDGIILLRKDDGVKINKKGYLVSQSYLDADNNIFMVYIYLQS